MKNGLRAFLILMCISLIGNKQAQAALDPSAGTDLIDTIVQDDPSWGWLSGTASQQGSGFRRANRFNAWELTHYGLEYEIESFWVRHAKHWSNGDEHGKSGGKWIQGWIHEDAPDYIPGRRLIKFSSRHASSDSEWHDGYRVARHRLSNGTPTTRLQANNHYWIVFDVDQNKSYNHVPRIRLVRSTGFGHTTSPSQWSIHRGLEAKAWDRLGIDHSANVGFWASHGSSPPWQFRIQGRRIIPDPLSIGDRIQAGNLEEENFSGWNIPNWHEARKETIGAYLWLATRFITLSSPGTPPHLFSVNHIQMLNPIRNQVPSNTHFIRIYGNKIVDGLNVPDRGKLIGEFSPARPNVILGSFPGSHSSDNNRQHRFHVRERHPIFLKPNTGYWIVQGMVHTFQGSSAKIISFTRGRNQKGWPIADEMMASTNRGQTWYRKVYDDRKMERTMRFELDLKIIPAKGDLNRDAKINILDLIAMNDEIREWRSLPSNTVALANLNGSNDAQIDATDRNVLIDIILGR